MPGPLDGTPKVQLSLDNDLYAYTSLRLMQANRRNDEEALEECRRLIEPLREAWAQIGNAAPAGA